MASAGLSAFVDVAKEELGVANLFAGTLVSAVI